MLDHAASEETLSAGHFRHTAPNNDTSALSEADDEWQRIHDTLVKLSRQASQLDWEIGVTLLRAEKARCHVALGYGTIAEYADRLFGYSPHTTEERLRVARSLEQLPAIREALQSGKACWSTVRELTRVATPKTESHWLAATQKLRVREVEQRVRGRQPGDSPDDDSDPKVERHTLRFSVSAETYATFREAEAAMQHEGGEAFDQDQLLREMARRVLAGPANEGRANYQIAMTVCEGCQQSWQEGRGEQIPVGDAMREVAECDGQHIGHVPTMGSASGLPGSASRSAASVDSRESEGAVVGPAAGTRPRRQRASQTIPPAVRRLVVRRDHGQCGVPGCRNTRFVDIHHTELRSEGGSHDPDKLLVLCGTHHLAVTRGDSWSRAAHPAASAFGTLMGASTESLLNLPGLLCIPRRSSPL